MAISKAIGETETVLAGDIGGTKTFLGLFRLSEDSLELLREGVYENGGFSRVDDVIRDFLGKAEPGRISAGSLGIAGPVVDNRSALTNLGWKLDGHEIAERFGIGEIKLINDLVATAWGVGVLAKDDFFTLQAGRKKAGNSALIAAGTGLGEAAMHWDGSAHIPSGSEAGHADFAPKDKTEIELLEYLLGFWDHVSYERVLSGPGLVNIYNFLKEKTGADEPAYLTERIRTEGAAPAVSDEAVDGKDKTCKDALDMFVSIYGAEAGNLALRSMALCGVYIGAASHRRYSPPLKAVCS